MNEKVQNAISVAFFMVLTIVCFVVILITLNWIGSENAKRNTERIQSCQNIQDENRYHTCLGDMGSTNR